MITFVFIKMLFKNENEKKNTKVYLYVYIFYIFHAVSHVERILNFQQNQYL